LLADREAATPVADPLDSQLLRAALVQLLEDDLRRHGLSPLGGV
jgi:hypothetical protein